MAEENEIERQLISAARRGDLRQVRQLVEESNVSINARGECGYTALHVSIVRRQKEVILWLLEHGANLNALTEDQMLPLDLATQGGEGGDRTIVEMIVTSAKKHGITLNPGKSGVNGLILACTKGDIDLARRMLEDFHTDCTSPGKGGICPLNAAFENGNIELIKLLLQTGDVEKIARTLKPVDLTTPFQIAIQRNSFELGELLAYTLPPEAHFDVVSKTGDSCLHYAVMNPEPFALRWIDLIITRAGDNMYHNFLIDKQRKDGMTALHLAMKSGKWKVVDRLLADGAKLNIPRNSDGETAFHMAFSANPAFLWRLINEFPIDPKQIRKDGSTPLFLACEQTGSDLRVVEKLLSICPNVVNLGRNDGFKPLHMAVVSGNRRIAECLLAAGADCNYKLNITGTNESFLHLVIGPQSENYAGKRFTRRPDWALMFLENKAGPKIDINVKRNDETTPLMLACTFCDIPVIRKLLEMGANPNVVTTNGNNALLLAYEKGHFEMVSMLLDAKAQIGCQSVKRNGETVLHTVLQRGMIDWIKLFVSKASPEDFMVQRMDRSIPLHIACEVDIDKTVFEEIVAKTKDINTPRINGITPLHIACRKGDLNIVRILLKHGANPKIAAFHNITPLHVACHAGHAPIAKLLISVGCDPQQMAGPIDVDEPDGNAVELARRAGNFRLARLLMDPLRSSLAVALHGIRLDIPDEYDQGTSGSSQSVESAMIFEPIPGKLEEGECSICGDRGTLLPLSRCGHKFCCDCLNSWFEAQFNGIQHPRCPNKDCGSIASYYDLKACMKHPEKYEEQALRHALMDIREFRWCPKCGFGGIAPCGDAICLQCGFNFCIECMLEKHELSCQEHLTKLLAGERGKNKEARQAREMQENQQWINSNTRQCPNCTANIKKSGGCSHMTCRACKYEFCWICMGKYQGKYTFDNNDPCKHQK